MIQPPGWPPGLPSDIPSFIEIMRVAEERGRRVAQVLAEAEARLAALPKLTIGGTEVAK